MPWLRDSYINSNYLYHLFSKNTGQKEALMLTD